MKKCTDRKLGRMLHAYELDLLSGPEKEEFEIHLLECGFCSSTVQRFLQSSDIMKEDAAVSKLMAKMTAEKRVRSSISSSFSTWLKPSFSKILPTVAVVAVLLILLVLKPWHIEFRTTKQASADQNRLAVLTFENLADPEDSSRTARILTSLLITDLSESDYMRVISADKLIGISRSVGYSDFEDLDEFTKIQIAGQAGARWVLNGKILQEKPGIILNVRLVDISSGDVEASRRITGGEDESIFSLADRTGAEVRSDLSLPYISRFESDRKVADITTHSAAAYQHYLEGHDYYRRRYLEEAAASFEKTLEYDSTFAMAYYYLANIRDRNLVEEALKFSSKASWKEKHFIESYYAYVHNDNQTAIKKLNDILARYPDEPKALYDLAVIKFGRNRYKEALYHLIRVINQNPEDKGAYQLMARAYDELHNYNEAIWAINKCIELAPNEANPYDLRGNIYARNGKLDSARISYEKALEKRPDFHSALANLGVSYVFANDFRKAESCFVELINAGDATINGFGYRYLTEAYAYRGELSRALQFSDSVLTLLRASDKEAVVSIVVPSLRFARALIYEQTGQYDHAVGEIQRAIELDRKYRPGDQARFTYTLIRLLADMGNFSEANKHAAELKAHVQDVSEAEPLYLYSMGSIEFAKGDYERAISYLEQASKGSNWFFIRYRLAQAYENNGRLDRAIATYESLLPSYPRDRLLWPFWAASIHYRLGTAYEAQGQVEKAVEQYKEFLRIQENADAGIEEVRDARVRLASLTSSP